MFNIRNLLLALAGALMLGFVLPGLGQAPKAAAKPPAANPAHVRAIFAGGCFWCM